VGLRLTQITGHGSRQLLALDREAPVPVPNYGMLADETWPARLVQFECFRRSETSAAAGHRKSAP
jgi:hypothetical protein